ncbi:hypothetical protein I302_103546 [Kwoniella bestiolae CBS 10118]|uniref:Uncharacterized protein n=1 Tax=Kwoniella bestiolae CBS 10118 TaxID=1296100 RepID=A0A1B9G8P2_9TREE|nr:hypothetical protein I302_02247 [Kwoniella bestiolae CBS 10118]OCF27405.1 hypothetical protein I302_02247 [Kwoniella bestiolae CBS 10118]
MDDSPPHAQGGDVPGNKQEDDDFSSVDGCDSDGERIPSEAYGTRVPHKDSSGLLLDRSTAKTLTKQVSRLGMDAISTAANAIAGTATVAHRSVSDLRSFLVPPVSTGIRDTNGSIKGDNRWWIHLHGDARLRTNLLEKLVRPYNTSTRSFYPCREEEPEEQIDKWSAWKFDRSECRIAYTEVSRPYSNTPLAIPDELLNATCICGDEMMLKNRQDNEESKEYLNGERWFYTMLTYDEKGKEQKRFARMKHRYELGRFTGGVTDGFELANSVEGRCPDDSTDVEGFIQALEKAPPLKSSSFVSAANKMVEIPPKMDVDDQFSAENASNEVKDKQEGEGEEESQTSCFSSRAHELLDGNEDEDDPIFHLDRGNTPN